MQRLKIAIVGRPNVGKSTLFNRLLIKSKSLYKAKAIVHDMPGVTRDRKYAVGELGDIQFDLIDTPGLEEAAKGSIEYDMTEQTIIAIKEADICMLVIDNLLGVTADDKHFANLIRKYSAKNILIVNKCEKNLQHDKDHFKLGFGEPVAISAEHGSGLIDLYELLIEICAEELKLYDEIQEQAQNNDYLKIAIVGRPNAGKSTLINSLIAENRLLTGASAGITRESIEVHMEYKGNKYALIDTAGLRKRANVTKSLEKLSTSDTINSINFANTVALVLDASCPLESQDITIAQYVIENGRGLIIVINKWDLVKDEKSYIEEIDYQLSKTLPQVKDVPVVYLSALNNKNTTSLLDASMKIYELWNKRIPTSKLNQWLANAVEAHPLPINKKLGRRVKIKYLTQVGSRPPTFKLFANIPESITESYQKYLINDFRDYFNMPGIVIRLRFTKSENPYAKNAKKK